MAENRRVRQPLVTCRCRSHCLEWDTINQTFGGDGRTVTRWTRDNHIKDDKRSSYSHTTPSASTSVANPQYTPISVPRPGDDSFLINDELDLMQKFPLASHIRPLVFVHDPSTAGPYTQEMDWHAVNNGIHALATDVRSNSEFLACEVRIAHLIARFSALMVNSSNAIVLSKLHSLWHTLNREREIHWSNQRAETFGRAGQRAVITGM